LKSLFSIITIVSFLVSAAYGQQPYKFRPVNQIPVEASGSNLELAWAGGLNSAQFGTIDLNDDDQPDLCIFDRTTNKINTFINTGTDYQYAPQYEYYFPANLNGWVVLADYDCDGRKDLFTNTTFGLKVYRNMSDDHLSFELQEDLLMTESGGQMVNLQVSSSDIPAISDVDEDGDLDILTFRFVSGGSIEYHQNQSMENNGDCSQLQYRLITTSWGNFEECSCGEYAFGKTCNDPGGRRQHAGGKSVLLIDQDHDGTKDLIFSDEFCTNIAFLYNWGDTENALFTSAVLDYPSSQNPIDYFLFPGLFYEDINFDGRKDLISSPAVFENFGQMVDFKRSIHLYPNEGTAGSEEFGFLTNQFLQDRMIELGENAAPVFFDVDGDGDQDMLVGHRGIRSGSGYWATFHLFENTGSGQAPEFVLIEEDYLNLSAVVLNTLQPSYADLDGDGKKDLVFSAATETGQTFIWFFLNNTSPGFEPVNPFPSVLPFNIQAGDHPHFQDLNNDGKADLLMGRRAGRLEYWNNSSSGNNFMFEIVTDSVAGIVDDSFRRELVPLAVDINHDGQLELVTTDATGVMKVYNNFLDTGGSNNPTQSFDLLIEPSADETSVRSRWGLGSSLSSADLGSQLPYLVIGSKQGGLYLLENLSEPGNGSGGSEFTLDMFPNPGTSGNDLITLQGNQDFTFLIYNSLGQLVYRDPGVPDQNLVRLDSRIFTPGIYLVKGISVSGASEVKKLIVAR